MSIIETKNPLPSERPTERPTDRAPHKDLIESARERGELRRYLENATEADRRLANIIDSWFDF